MARVLTNNVTLAFAIEASIGVLPGTPEWRSLEPNNINAFGAEISTTPRRPISPDRGRKKGTVTDLDSSVEYEEDLTMQAFENFAEGFVFAEFANVEFDLKETLLPPPVATATTMTIDAASALLAGKVDAGTGFGTLIYNKGYLLSGNNGFHVLTVDLAPSGTTLTMAGSSMTAETPPVTASCQVAGLQADDITVTIDAPSAGLATLVSAADIDWTTTGIGVGQMVHLGSDDGTGAVQNAMDDTGTNDVFGYCRVRTVTATTLTVDKLDVNLGAGSSPYTPALLDIMFGRFLRNVKVTDSVDDTRFLERSYQIEASYPDLGGPGLDEYEYAIGNFANEIALEFPAQDKAGLSLGFIGTNSDEITRQAKTDQIALSASIANGGSGYIATEVLTLTTGTGAQATFTVDSVTGGVVDSVTLTTAGDYSVLPDDPTVTTASVAGTGATLNVLYGKQTEPTAPLRTTAVNTSSDLASLSTDLISLVGDVCFKSLTLTLNNNVSPEKCLGKLGAVFVNNGLFEVNLEAVLLFTTKEIVNAVRNNTTITFAAIMKNEDGAIAFDIPSLTLGGGDREFPVDESVTVNLTGEAFNDPSGVIPNVSLGISLFPSVPTVRPAE